MTDTQQKAGAGEQGNPSHPDTQVESEIGPGQALAWKGRLPRIIRKAYAQAERDEQRRLAGIEDTHSRSLERSEMKEKEKTKMALVYDFDGTLAPGHMQNRQFIPDTIGMGVERFWEEVNRRAEVHEADPILTYMYVMLEKCREAGVQVHRQDLAVRSEETRFFPGVEGWFDRTTGYASRRGIDLQHYCVSSGNAEIIEATSIARYFHRIYASRFMYDQEGVAVWPAVAINFTTKTQYLFRINKGALDQRDMSMINRYIPREQRAVPFENMVYLGDGETDVPCFRVIRDTGGLAVAVHDAGSHHAALEYLRDGRVDAVAPADYREGQRLDRLVQSRIDLVAATARLQEITLQDR